MEGEGSFSPGSSIEGSIPPNALVDNLKDQGLQARQITAGNREIIMVDRPEKEAEGMITVYRGVNQLDADSLTNQASYILRKIDGIDRVSVREELKDSVMSLTQEPSYDKLRNIYDELVRNARPEELRIYEEDMQDIEEIILGGDSLRSALKIMQIKHGVGSSFVTTPGLAPYVSATPDAEKAKSYVANEGGLMIITLPLTRLNKWNAQGEVGIKGWIEPDEITAIIPNINSSTPSEEVNQLLSTVNTESGLKTLNPVEVLTERGKLTEQETKWDEEHKQSDLAQVRKIRVDLLIRKFHDLDWSEYNEYSLEDYGSENLYKKARERIFDHYNDRLNRMGLDLKDSGYTYKPKNGNEKPISRESTDEEMLFELYRLYDSREERLLPRYAEVLGLKLYASFEDVQDQRDKLFRIAQENDIPVDSNDYSLAQIKRVNKALSIKLS